MNHHSLRLLIVGAIGIALLVSACGAPAAAPVPQGPKVGDSLTVKDSLSVRATGHASLEEAVLLKEDGKGTVSRTAGSGMAWHAVTVEFALAGSSTQTMTLNLGDAHIADKSGNTWPATSLTHVGDVQSPSKLGFFNGIGKEGQGDLDFGVGFTGNQMSMSVSYPGAYLSVLHLDSPAALTFLFEVPQGSQPATFRLWSLPAVELNP